MVDAFDVDFHRVFGGCDVAFFGVEHVEAGVERHRLAAAGGAGDEDHSLGQGEGFEEEALLLGVEAELVHADLRRGRIENAQDDLLAPHGRHGVDPHVDAAFALQGEAQASVLGNAAFGDVELGHHLQPRCEAGPHLHRRLAFLAQDAVDAEAHAARAAVGLEVNVGGAGADRVK